MELRPQSNSNGRKGILLVFYGNPDYMPFIFRETVKLSERFRVHILSFEDKIRAIEWPEGVEIERVQPKFGKVRKRLLSRITKNLDYIKFIRIVRQRIRDLRPAIIFPHDARAMVATVIANQAFKIPVIYQSLDIYEDTEPWHSLNGYIERYAARAGLRAKLVMVFAEGRAEHFRKLTCSAYPNILVLPSYPSLDIQPDRSSLEKLIKQRFEKKTIIYPGVINRFVAIEDAVRALALLREQWSMSMLGEIEPSMLGELKKLAVTLGAEKRLTHGGWIPPANALSATNLGTVGVVLFKPVSINYATMSTSSNKLWEFAARGIPVVVPNTADYRDVLQNEKWAAFFDLGNPVSLAHSIVRLTSNYAEYKSASEAAYNAVRSSFNFEKIFPTALDTFLEIASGSESRFSA